jgi:hypothetical protein
MRTDALAEALRSLLCPVRKSRTCHALAQAAFCEKIFLKSSNELIQQVIRVVNQTDENACHYLSRSRLDVGKQPCVPAVQRHKAFARLASHVSHLSHSSYLSQTPLIAHAPRDALAIELLQKWHHNSPRTLQRLAQFAHRGRSIPRYKIRNLMFHALEVLAQQNHIRPNFT